MTCHRVPDETPGDIQKVSRNPEFELKTLKKMGLLLQLGSAWSVPFEDYSVAITMAVLFLSLGLIFVWKSRNAVGPPVIGAWIPFIGCGVAFGKDPMGFLRRCVEKVLKKNFHGDRFSMELFLH